MTDWDEIAREVAERNARENDEAMQSPRYLAKREKLRQQIDAGLFDGEIEYADGDDDTEEED